jgi:siroheme synthase-like protein
MNDLFPVFLKLRDRLCVVVGAGNVAEAKVASLLAAGATLRIVSPSASFALEHPRVTWVRRAFEPRDLEGAWYVTAAATPEVNRQVAAAAEERRLFVNAVDDPEAASAYLGGVVRKHGFIVALCGNGTAPALTGLLREALESILPGDFESWLARAVELRDRWRADGVPMARRRPLLLEALNALYVRRAPREVEELR